MAKFRTITENSKGNEVKASNHYKAKARLQTLRKGLTRYNSGQSEFSQVVPMEVTLYRNENGDLCLLVDLQEITEVLRVSVRKPYDQIETALLVNPASLNLFS